MELMKENQPVQLEATWNERSVDGLDLLLKASQKTTPPKNAVQKKSKVPSMVLTGSYETPVIVGRGSQATLNLGRINKQVSRRHAIVQWCAELSAFQIIVLGQNGVRINGTGYPSGQQKILREGDIVDLVGVKMLFREPVESSPKLQENQDYLDQSDVESTPLGLVTPKRTPKKVPAYQLATPDHSSPIHESLQLTPTARMPHKMLKYNTSSADRVPFDSPSSDVGTEFGSSPVQSRPIFTLPLDASPVRRPIGLETPKSEANFSMDGQFPDSPSKHSTQRTPLAPLSLADNRQRNTPKPRTTTSHTSTVPSTQTLSSPSKTKASGVLKQSSPGNVEKQQHKSNASASETENIKPSTSKQEKLKATKDQHKATLETTKVKATHESATEVMPKADKTTSGPLSSSDKGKVHPAKASKEGTKKSIPPSPSTKHTKEQTSESFEKKSKQKDTEDPENDEFSSSSRESSPEEPVTKSPVDYTESIIDTLVFARKKKSMTLSELYEEMIASQPSLVASQSPEEIKEQMLQCLSSASCVGKISRKGKDAYNKPLESQWYYIPEADHNVMRKLTRQEVMPSARKCTLKDKQYFFKMPPKLPYHRKSTSPYAVKQAVRRTKELSKLSGADETEDGEESSSDPDEESAEAVSSTKKRKSANNGHVEKKRKSVVSSEKAEAKDKGAEDDEDDDAQNDSLDDVSELSGLSD
ncbi:hypothetical protein BGX21_002227 [Mortierella sp. AD011]|nr:hypothetical protein BGX20_002424 [Mortierella sp. AD010]KAF9401260.1 hypothetical protein BGX21_002227 [Mortierella sp. AD011]